MGAASRLVKKGKVDADQTANFHQSCKVCVDPVTDTAAMIVTPPQASQNVSCFPHTKLGRKQDNKAASQTSRIIDYRKSCFKNLSIYRKVKT